MLTSVFHEDRRATVPRLSGMSQYHSFVCQDWGPAQEKLVEKQAGREQGRQVLWQPRLVLDSQKSWSLRWTLRPKEQPWTWQSRVTVKVIRTRGRRDVQLWVEAWQGVRETDGRHQNRLSFSLWTWATFQTLSLMKEEMARCHRERNPGFHSKFSQGINSQRSCYHLFEHVCVREYLVFWELFDADFMLTLRIRDPQESPFSPFYMGGQILWSLHLLVWNWD